MKVLVTGLFPQAGLFAVRRFGQMGFKITAADSHKLAYGMYSKFVSKRIILPCLRTNPAGYAEAILDELRCNRYDFYFPSFEELYLMSAYRDELQEYTCCVLPEYNDLMRLHDKSLLKEVVAKAGLHYPETFTPKSMAEIEMLSSRINYPVYVKIRQSSNSTGLRMVEKSCNIMDGCLDVMNRNELNEDNIPLIQRAISGMEFTCSALVQDGKVVGEVCYVGIRSIPRSGGTTTCRKVVSNKACSDVLAAFVLHLNWTGFIAVDLIVDEETKIPFIIDVNPRPTVFVNTAYYSGIDLLPAWIKIAKGKKAEKMDKCTEGVKSSFLYRS